MMGLPPSTPNISRKTAALEPPAVNLEWKNETLYKTVSKLSVQCRA